MRYSTKLAKIIAADKIVVIPTDTIFGVAASAFSAKAVERAYKILKRNTKKPFIILVSSFEDLALFDVRLDAAAEKILEKIWPGKVSVILPCLPAKASATAGLSKKFEYLHRGTKSLAFRLPKKKSLIALLKKTGPLVSTSANPEGKKPAETIAEAKRYFGESVDFYAGDGKMKSLPSTLVEIKNGKISVLRKGSGRLPGIQPRW